MTPDALFTPLTLPCGVVLKNRIVKSAMSDSLGDGRGDPTAAQSRLYRRWAEGGVAASIIGEVQGNPEAAEKPGNLVLSEGSDHAALQTLAQAGAAQGAQLWVQLGHAGAMAHPPISTPKGPSDLAIGSLRCAAMTTLDITALPFEFARTAAWAKAAGFGGVQVHAAHGFLLSQFLSPLFNRRSDAYGGRIENRMRLLLEVIDAVRDAVGPDYPVAVKLNASDQLEGGFDHEDALAVVAALDRSPIDLIDISGGTYFPGARSASDSGGKGPYFIDFAKAARALTDMPLMLTGGIKTRAQAVDVRQSGVDLIGLARGLILSPSLPQLWWEEVASDPQFPRFENLPEGGVTAWYTMRMAHLAGAGPDYSPQDLPQALADYEARDTQRAASWTARFRGK
ncbi:oxidoreductase [Sagittula sp. SSi028]|uniref:oxidoreductase n=1 Tax=Sagittula sp. SSi028 TaxID=3400636 RepID=UPI003AF9AA99